MVKLSLAIRVLYFNAFAGGDPHTNIWTNFISPETRMIVLPDAETVRSKIVSSFLWTKHWNVMEGQTDRRTESLWLLQHSALRAMRMCCKKLNGSPGHVYRHIVFSVPLSTRLAVCMGKGKRVHVNWPAV